MRLRQLSGIFLLVLSAVPQVAESKTPTVLDPAGAWTLDYAPERCSLIRRFGDDEKSVVLQIDSYGSRRQFRILVSGDYVPSSNKPSGLIDYKFTPDQDYRRNQSALLGKSGKSNLTTFGASFLPADVANPDISKMSQEEINRRSAGMEEIQPEFEQAIDSITLQLSQAQEIELRLGKMAKPLAALRTCVDDLYRSWGLDPVLQRSRTKSPIPDLKSIKKALSYYPPKMVRNGISAYLSVRIMVDAQGQASSCVVQNETVDNAFKSAVCDSLAGRFEPALDADGKPMAGIYHTNVIFMLH
ncbi:MAG TPA: energy transducer TonB [Sphingomonadaceae bacterium]|nr:energy transducer TonB [Sphingomonadaceae bacterium]